MSTKKKMMSISMSTITATTATTDDFQSPYSYAEEEEEEHSPSKRKPSRRLTRQASSFSVAASTILAKPSYRFKTQSSLPWGHRPHPVLGVSCLCYLLIVPFLLPCYPMAAGMFILTTLCSYCSDHLYTGVDSMAHMFDKLVAPTTFAFALNAIYSTGGLTWAITSNIAVVCHVLAMAAAKQNNYEGFVLWHTLWHVVGVGLMIACCIVNSTMTECMVPGKEEEMGLWYGL